MILHSFPAAVAWNLLLPTLGSIIVAIGTRGAGVNTCFITRGACGAALLLWHKTDFFSPPLCNLLVALPLFALCWFVVSRRFCWYSLPGMLAITVASKWLAFDCPIKKQPYPAMAGGLDIAPAIFNTPLNIGLGKVCTFFNPILFTLTIPFDSRFFLSPPSSWSLSPRPWSIAFFPCSINAKSSM
jgi:uncharacterized membrane-anchored protein YitT (DUF2179 family)